MDDTFSASQSAVTPASDALEAPRHLHLNRSLASRGPSIFMAFASIVLAAPTVLTIARSSWTDEQSQLAPLVLAIGGWLLWRRWAAMRNAGTVGSAPIGALALTLCAIIYVAGRISSLALLEAYALYGFLVASVYVLVGREGVLRGAFPLLLIALAAPIPFAVGWPVTVVLRQAISAATVSVMTLFHVPAARDGLTLFISNYRIEIAQACSGMNSLLSLSVLSVCYVHLRRSPPLTYLLIISPFVIFFAVVANLVRVILLAAVTLILGDGAAQSILHQALGLATFSAALVMTFVADEVLARVRGTSIARGWPS